MKNRNAVPSDEQQALQISGDVKNHQASRWDA
jgi:hypothetical protein